MNPVDVHEAVRRFLEWDIDRIAALIAGLLIATVIAWRLRSHLHAQVKDLKTENDRSAREIRDLQDKVQQLRDQNHSLKDAIREATVKLKQTELDEHVRSDEKLRGIRQQLEQFESNDNGSEDLQETARRKKIEEIRARLGDTNICEGNNNAND